MKTPDALLNSFVITIPEPPLPAVGAGGFPEPPAPPPVFAEALFPLAEFIDQAEPPPGPAAPPAVPGPPAPPRCCAETCSAKPEKEIKCGLRGDVSTFDFCSSVLPHFPFLPL